MDEKPGTTRDLLNAKFSFKDKRFEIVDSAGIKKRSRITEPIEFYSMMRVLHFIDQANLVILIFDVNEGIVREDCRIAELVLSKAKGLVIAANKIDLVKNKDKRKILPSVKKSLDFIDFAPVHLISARARLGIEELLNSVLHVHNELSKMASQEALDTIASTIKPPPGGQVTRITQVSKKPPVFSVIMTVPVRESYVRYLRNTLRNYFGYTCVPILIRTKVKKI